MSDPEDIPTSSVTDDAKEADDLDKDAQLPEVSPTADLPTDCLIEYQPVPTEQHDDLAPVSEGVEHSEPASTVELEESDQVSTGEDTTHQHVDELESISHVEETPIETLPQAEELVTETEANPVEEEVMETIDPESQIQNTSTEASEFPQVDEPVQDTQQPAQLDEHEQPVNSQVESDQPVNSQVESDQPVNSQVESDQPIAPDLEVDATERAKDQPVDPEVEEAEEQTSKEPVDPEPAKDVDMEDVENVSPEKEKQIDVATGPVITTEEGAQHDSAENTNEDGNHSNGENSEAKRSEQTTEETQGEESETKKPVETNGSESTKDSDVSMSEDSSIEKPNDRSAEKTSDPIIRISTVSGNVDIDMTDCEEVPKDDTAAVGGLKISSVTSGTVATVVEDDDDDVVQILDEEGDQNKEKSGEAVSAKKPMLKLASFAGLGSNGISDGTPLAHQEFGVCGQCTQKVRSFYNALMWEAMLFCNVTCLADYQLKMNNCATCKKSVLATSMGKYCVRFGSDIKQFCSNVCLEDHKKGLKVCSYCQKDISGGEGFLAPIGDKGQFKDFCMPDCLQKYEAMHCGKPIEKEVSACAVCSQVKTVEVQLLLTSDRSIKLCSGPCMSAYKFGNNIEAVQCDLCKKECDSKQYRSLLVIHYSGKSKTFCSAPCQNVYVMQARDIVPCLWCKVKKYNFDMIERLTGEGCPSTHFCSVNCLNVHTNSKQGVPIMPHLTQHMNGMPSQQHQQQQLPQPSLPVIQSVSSLAGAGEPPARPDRLPTEPVPQSQIQQMQQQQQVQIVSQTVTNTVKETMVKFPEPIEMRNKGTMAKPFMHTKGVSCRPHPCHKSTQTEGPSLPVIAPVGVPLYMPVPTAMYQKPYPVPIPIPIPIPVPVFIPTTRNSARGIMKQIKKIRSKLPADPFEAELLAMAGALVEKDKNTQLSDDNSDDSMDDDGVDGWDGYDAGAQGVNNVNNQEMQMQAAADLECDIKADRVVPKPLPQVTPDPCTSPQPFGFNRQQVQAVTPTPTPMPIPGRQPTPMQPVRGQPTKRRYSQREDGEEEEDENSPWKQRQNWDGRAKPARGRSNRAKQVRTDMTGRDPSAAITSMMNKPPEERPDAKHHLKFTYGVNAWKHWVVGKNAELEKARAQGRYMKPFETDILKLRADELNYTLCMFVKEVKKPNGDSYAPDSILYLTLGIQEYLFENGRIDNIFMDTYYEPFTSALHDVVKDFRLPVNEMGYFVTRIEEEHLWESKQLGAHSPQVLLNTLVYFNTKFFMLKNMDDHTKLAFTHIMKHWKKGNTLTPASAKPVSNSPGNQGRSVLLKYYPPANKVSNRHDDRKCYEQHENTDNPLRCPVKLYEFYLSKCPESMKSRNDTFYLQPERSCVPDSPVWYTASSLVSISLDKMLQRIIMVREVQEHMLADAS